MQHTSLTSKSPDEKYLAEIFETPGRGFPSDRQFQVILYSTANTNKYRIIYHSPDEGTPGTERFIWSRDSRYFLLLGKRFSIETNAPFTFLNSAYKSDEYGYLLYDVVESKVMCNSSQDTRYPRFFLTNLIGKDFDPAVLPELIRTNR